MVGMEKTLKSRFSLGWSWPNLSKRYGQGVAKVWPIKGIKTDYEQQNNKNNIFIKFNMINYRIVV